MKYISLLIFSGLIIRFYNSAALHGNKSEKHSIQNTRCIPGKKALAPFSFFNDVVVTFFPALKN